MFQKALVLYISKTKIVVKNGGQPKPLALKYDGESLKPHLSKIKKVYNPSSIRIILADDSSYVMTLKIPQSKAQKQNIFEEARSIIPETLTSNNYDWRVVGATKTDSLIEVFACPLSLIQEISRAVKELGLMVETIMPVAFLIAHETAKITSGHIVLWEGEDKVLLLANGGAVYSTRSVGAAIKDDFESLIKTAKAEYGIALNRLVTNSDNLSKLITFPKSWKVEKIQLNPFQTIQSFSNADKNKESVLAASIIVDIEKKTEESKQVQDSGAGYGVQTGDESEILAPHIKGLMDDEANGVERTPQRRSKSKLIIIVAVVALVLVFAAFFVLRNRSTGQEIAESPTAAPSVSDKPLENVAATIAPSPVVPLEIVEAFELSDYALQVQNGSGQAGVAGEIAEILESAGFLAVETGNAESPDYTDITIIVKELVDERAIESAKEALANTDYEILVSDDNLEADGEFDMVLIVGSN